MSVWNPWHGCKKISPGCLNCYVYRTDSRHGKDSSIITKTKSFNLPIAKKRNGEYKLLSGGDYIYTCFTSDFFLEEADSFRPEAWEMIRLRTDLKFLIITKRIHRFSSCIPSDWGDGYENVTICCTTENQDRADYRLPIFLDAPIKHKMIVCEPILERIDLLPYLNNTIECVVAGGESGPQARLCDYSWILDLKNQCVLNNIAFTFKQTGANFKKGDIVYHIKRQYQHSQARKSKTSFRPKK